VESSAREKVGTDPPRVHYHALDRVTDRFAYLAFLTVVGVGLALMTLGLAATAIIFFLQRRRSLRGHEQHTVRSRP